ncbi:MAG TPA: flagellar basal body-associated FliL family protein [Woeseiaceae bacterium]|nr:flagellar basal body-associated FliL family protein [Woeseiaceae bacterium]
MNQPNATGAPAGAKTGKTLIIAVVGIVALAAAGLGGSLLGARLAGTNATAAGEAAPDTRPALYHSLLPPLVVNFRDSVGDSHYMQVSLDVMSRDPLVIEAVKQHSAAIRNSLILLFSDIVDYAAINTREHKERLLADALAEVREVVRERTGRDAVEAVYFTSLIVQ